jgi:hypothetical protein
MKGEKKNDSDISHFRAHARYIVSSMIPKGWAELIASSETPDSISVGG